MSRIVMKTWAKIEARHQKELDGITIEDAVFGRYLCAVKLSNNQYGVSSIIEDDKVHCDKALRDYGPFTPLQIRGRSLPELFDYQKESATVNMLRIAVLNALSSLYISDESVKLMVDTDPIDLLDIKTGQRVILVGAFHSYIKHCLKAGANLGVLEMNQDALSDNHRSLFIPADQFEVVIPDAEVLIITGLTLVNDTLEGLLKAVRPGTKVVVTGPSSSIIPHVLFDYGVDMVGGIRITKPEVLFSLVGQGAAGYHLFKYCAEKITMKKC